jgi:hypothetical protein
MTKDGPTPTDPGTIDLKWITRFEDEVCRIPDRDLSRSEKLVILKLARRIIVTPGDGGRGCYTMTIEAMADKSGVSLPTAERAIRKARSAGYVIQVRRGHGLYKRAKTSRASTWTLEMPSIAAALIQPAKQIKRQSQNSDIRRDFAPCEKEENPVTRNEARSEKEIRNMRDDLMGCMSAKNSSASNGSGSHKETKAMDDDLMGCMNPTIKGPSNASGQAIQPITGDGLIDHTPLGGDSVRKTPRLMGETSDSPARETVDPSLAASPSRTGAPLDAPFEAWGYDPETEIFVEADDHHAAESSSRDRDLATETSSATEEIGAAAATHAAAARSSANGAPVDVSDTSATPVAGCDDEVPDDAYFEMLASMEQEAEVSPADDIDEDILRAAIEYDARMAAAATARK